MFKVSNLKVASSILNKGSIYGKASITTCPHSIRRLTGSNQPVRQDRTEVLSNAATLQTIHGITNDQT